MMASRRCFVAGAAALAATKVDAEPPRLSPVVELRQYTLHRDQRDVLIRLFEREFVESQEAVGAQIIGTFRDLDDPDRFVWMRGFESMEQRATVLGAFYGGPVWQAHRNEANPTMLDSDNVLLLHPARPGGGFAPARRDDGRRAGLIVATIHALDDATAAPFAAFFDASMRPGLEAEGARILASFASETSPNSFPRLPIREDRVFVWFARFDDEAAHRAYEARRRVLSGWRDPAPESLLKAFMRKPEVLRLLPTARSALR